MCPLSSIQWTLPRVSKGLLAFSLTSHSDKSHTSYVQRERRNTVIADIDDRMMMVSFSLNRGRSLDTSRPNMLLRGIL